MLFSLPNALYANLNLDDSCSVVGSSDCGLDWGLFFYFLLGRRITKAMDMGEIEI